MLHEPMRTSGAWLVGVCFVHLCHGQVHVDVPVQFTGADAQRTVQGLGAPAQSDAMITVEGSARAEWGWATASLEVNTLVLDFPIAPAMARDGLLLRFLSPGELQGALWLQLPDQAPLELVRTDGVPISDGQIVAGQVCEVLHANGRFYLLNASESGCPSGYLQVNDNYCIESTSSAGVPFYVAVDQCASKGGKLCTWDEYQAACYLMDGQFSNMSADWEWIDDMSNHLHTANQAGRTSCESIRSRIVTYTSRVRCCHHLR